MLYIKFDTIDGETYWKTICHKIGMSHWTSVIQEYTFSARDMLY